MRLSFSGGADEPLVVGENRDGDVSVHVDDEERFHNLYGPAHGVGGHDSDGTGLLYAIHGKDVSPQDYPYVAAATAADEDPEMAGDGLEDTNSKWLRKRVEAFLASCGQLEDDVLFHEEYGDGDGWFAVEGEDYVEVDLAERFAACATMENVEAIQAFVQRYAWDVGVAGPNNPPLVEAAIAKGFLKPERADPKELARSARGAGAPKPVSSRLAKLAPEAALAAAPAVLAAVWDGGGWDAVADLLPKPSRGAAPRP